MQLHEMASDRANAAEIRAGVPLEVLDIFWGLSSTNDNERAKSTLSLISALEKKKLLLDSKPEDDKANTLLQYTLKRLITGLSSSRKAAPLGFATALCEVLKRYGQDTSTDELLKLTNQNLQTSKQDNKGQKTHTNLGKILVYTSLMRSGIIAEATNADICNMVKSLSKIRSRFPMLAAATTEAISQLCSCVLSINASELESIILEQLDEELTGGWQRCTADTLQLLFVLEDKKLVDEEFLLEHWQHKALIGSKSLPHLAAIMIQSTSHSPAVHGVNKEIVARTLTHGLKLFKKLWKDVIMGGVFNTDKPARCYMIYQLIPDALRASCKPDLISTILCPELIGPLMKQMTYRDSYLHKAAVKLVADVVSVVKDATDATVQLEILKCLMSEPGSFMFDSLTSTRTLSNIIAHLQHAAAAQLSQELMNVICTDTPLFGRRNEGIVGWCSNTLAHMLTLNSVITETVDQTWQADILKFLMLHSCFVITSPLADLDHCQQVVVLADSDRASVKDALLKGLAILSTYQSAQKGAGGKLVTIDYREILHSLFKYTGHLLENKNSIAPFIAITDEELLVWSDLKKTSKRIQKLQKEDEDDKAKVSMYTAFQLMLELFALHMFIVDLSERSEVADTIKEIQTCFDKAVSRKKSKKEEPTWCDVITEVLISLMSKSSHLLRTVSSSVFTKILPMCDVTSIQLILDVFQSGDDEFDADENDSAEDEDMMSSEHDDEDGESSTMSSDDSSSEEEEGEEVDENMRATVQAALGSAAVADSDQEDDKDLSDEEMIKLDDALSEAFRSMRRKNKNSPEELQKRREVRHFKLRCLDLVDVVVKHSTRGELLLELIVPLMTLIEAGFKEKEMKEIGKKAQTIHHHLTSLKKLPKCSVTDSDDVSEKVGELLALSTNAYVWPIMKEISGSLNFMIKLLSHAKLTGVRKSKRGEQSVLTEAGEDNLVSLVTDKVHTALTEFLTKRESRYSHTLFQGVFERQHVLFWRCSTDLLQAISSSDTRIFYRTQACALLLNLLHKDIITEIGVSTWQKFAAALVKSIEQVAAYSVENYKPGFLLEFFSMLQRAKTVDKTLIVDVSTFETLKSKFSKDLMKVYKRVAALPTTPVKASTKRKTTLSSIDAAVSTTSSKKMK